MDFLLDPRFLSILTTIVMAAIVLYLLSRLNKPVDVTTVIQAVKEAKPLVAEVMDVAKMAVFAAEQYAKTGQIPDTPDEKLTFAFGVFRKWIPALKGISDEDALEAIHSFVPEVNSFFGKEVLLEKPDVKFDDTFGYPPPPGNPL